MGDTETLFLMLGIIYLMECCLPADKNALIFAPAPFACKMRQGFFITLKSVLVILNPIPLFSRVSISDLTPLSFCISGVALYNSLLPNGGNLKFGRGAFIAYTEITRLEVKDSLLRINEFEIPCADGEHAAKLASELRELTALIKNRMRLNRPVEQAVERKLCSSLASRFNVSAARQRQRQLFWYSLAPAVAATFLFTYLFTLLPVGLFLSSSRTVWYALGLMLASLHFLTVFFFWLSHRELYPGKSEERLKKLLTMLFNPFSSMRCPTQLCRDGLAEFHPLLAGYVSLRGMRRRKFMHRVWCGLTYNLPLTEDAAQTREQLALHNFLLAALLQKGLAEAGEVPPPLLRPDYDPTAKVYCPACLIQYAAEIEECLYCPSVPLCKSIR